MSVLSPPPEVAIRVDQLVGPAVPAAPFGTYVVGSRHPGASLGRRLELEVFAEVFGNSEELLAAEYDPYEAGSLFVMVVDHRRRTPAGMLRLVLPSPAGLKSLNDVRRVWGRSPDRLIRSTGLDPAGSTTWDLATLAVAPHYRRAALRGLVSLALWQAVGVLAARCGVDLLVGIVDVPVYRLLQLKLGAPFSTFDNLTARPYLDSPASVAVWCRPAQWRTRFAEADPDLYRMMIEGKGLEAAVAPPDWDEAAATARLVPGTGRQSSAGDQT